MRGGRICMKGIDERIKNVREEVRKKSFRTEFQRPIFNTLFSNKEYVPVPYGARVLEEPWPPSTQISIRLFSEPSVSSH
jgi:hypothetical protein